MTYDERYRHVILNTRRLKSNEFVFRYEDRVFNCEDLRDMFRYIEMLTNNTIRIDRMKDYTLPKDHKGNEQFGYKVVELKNLDEDGEEKI
jgi:Lon protease-like protein